MHGPPLEFKLKEDVKPHAVYVPAAVPAHWQEKVKADIERDVALCVLEPVPPNVAMTWCHRMVICAKKDGTPRRTIDFQALNRHASRETHHNPSPFHIARSVPHNMKKKQYVMHGTAIMALS